ncbi:MAG TPA: alpha/beta fold hydrolase [Thermoanaerobaculia bacterium]|nr:alpha/beta fold hydrolase [Thermoanaerobaculia bacterium]
MAIESTADFVRMTRDALAAAGFVRREIEGTVYWDSGGQAILPVRTGRIACPPLVLVHGVNDQAGSWFAVAPTLARTHRVILPDLPGHGESEPKEGPLAISMMVARLHSVIGNSRVTLAGNSLGGWIAMLYTLAYPERVSHLVLEASGGLDRPFGVPVIATTRDEALTILRAVHGPRFVATEWMIDSLLQRATNSPMLRITETEQLFVDARIADIRVPATIIWGADDGVLPLSYAHALQAGIAGARLHVIEGAAHIPHIQQPERFLACLPSTS